MERGYWIKSKPIYQSLVWHNTATSHLVVAQGQGGMAVLKLFQQMHPKQPVTVLYEQQAESDVDYANTLNKVTNEDLLVLESTQEVVSVLKKIMPQKHMGLRIYVAGSEAFIWAVAEAVKECGVEDGDIMKELTGTLARTIYCVHCKAITHNIKTNVGKCSGCGRMLFVRDHFSRNLGAYMGLMVDAESPGELPEIEEIYP
ncbi:MAG: dimethylamine monooxygenase subunit DmmA family protein [Pseudomonadota bacterium]